MSSFVPNNVPGLWNALLLRGSTWPATTIAYSRDGVAVVPVSAALYFHVDGVLATTIAATIDGGGIMTIAGLTAVQTAAINWDYGNLSFVTVESGSVTTLLLAGNVSVVNRGD